MHQGEEFKWLVSQDKRTCSTILWRRTWSRSRILRATESPVSTLVANLTFAKLPSPRVLPSSYLPTRVRVAGALALILSSLVGEKSQPSYDAEARNAFKCRGEDWLVLVCSAISLRRHRVGPTGLWCGWVPFLTHSFFLILSAAFAFAFATLFLLLSLPCLLPIQLFFGFFLVITIQLWLPKTFLCVFPN